MWFASSVLLLLLGTIHGGLAATCDFPQSLCFDSEPALTNLDLLEAAINAIGQIPDTFIKPDDLLALINQIIAKVKEAASLGPGSYKSCADVPAGSPSGLYLLQGEFEKVAYYAYCEMSSYGGGWLVFHRRFNGQVDFLRTWSDYQSGFGDLKSGEFWWGLNNLYRATNLAPHELLVVLEDFDGVIVTANYNAFQIGGEAELYRLNVLGTYTGAAGDSLRRHLGSPFTTTDKDNDKFTLNCAQQSAGAWWYTDCHDSNLNGRYLNGPTSLFGKAMSWSTFKGPSYALKSARMMIRRLP
uniref:Fibrinogen C-terminal domain-containing protein n=1 Tax=Anopheles farauti TaxID=69004 RepID=A0A182Q6C6_9DIPT